MEKKEDSTKIIRFQDIGNQYNNDK